VQDEKLDIDVTSFSTEDTDPATVLSDLIDLWDVNPLDVVEEYVMLDNDRSSCTATVEEYKKVADGLDVTYEMAYDLYDLAGNETVQTTTWYVHYSGLSDEELKKFSSSEGGQQADMQMSKQETVDGADGGVKSAEEDGIEKVTQEWTVTEVASQQDATEVYTIPATRTTGYQSDMEQGIFQQVNDIRDDNYLNTLLWNEELVPYAKRRALEIIENFSHDSAGGQLENVGENIAEGYPSVDEVMDAWMDSPSHRENILNIYYKSIAVSVYYNGYSYYLVQNFGI
jgi:uncharacterized protein YkwD